MYMFIIYTVEGQSAPEVVKGILMGVTEDEASKYCVNKRRYTGELYHYRKAELIRDFEKTMQLFSK